MESYIIPFLVSLLMGMGIGGGGLYIIYLTSLLEMEATTARGTNLVFFIVTALASLLVHLSKRRFYIGQIIIMVAFGSLGSYIFSHLSNSIDPEIPTKFLGGFLILGGGVSIFSALKSFFRKDP